MSMDLEQQAANFAGEFGIPKYTFLGLVKAESHWNPQAVSPQGAIGLTQIMPNTAVALGYDPSLLRNDPALQLEAGAKYLSQMYDIFGNWNLALAAYNAGPGAVQKYGGLPPFPATKRLINMVLKYAEEYREEDFATLE